MRLARLAPLAALLVAALPAHALFKIVGPDGSVTYTDRAPPASAGKVSALTAAGAPVPDTALPAELRPVAQRYPVTLYTAPDCAPCDEARRLLRQRGVPHTEKTIFGDEDREAWQRIVGGPEAPAMTVGQQSVRGLSAEKWSEYLDAAGYPKTSKLPPNYRFADALPLVPRQAAQARVAPPAAAPAPADSGDADGTASKGFRF